MKFIAYLKCLIFQVFTEMNSEHEGQLRSENAVIITTDFGFVLEFKTFRRKMCFISRTLLMLRKHYILQ